LRFNTPPDDGPLLHLRGTHQAGDVSPDKTDGRAGSMDRRIVADAVSVKQAAICS